MFGIDRYDSGELFVEGERTAIHSPSDAIKAGIGFVPEDRKLKGLLLGMAVKDNVSLANLGQVSRYGVLKAGLERFLAESFIKKLSIKTSDYKQKVLQAYNQQKVVLSKWLCRSTFTIAHQVWTGAKRDSFASQSAYREGVSVVMVSSELPETGNERQDPVMHQGKVGSAFARRRRYLLWHWQNNLP